MSEMMSYLRAGLIGGAGVLAAMMPSLAQAQLAVSIGGGESVRGQTETFTFQSNTAVVTGGSGSYSYLWAPVSISGLGHWSSGSGASFAPTATIYTDCEDSTAVYAVTVTDKISGATATSNTATYYYDYYNVVYPHSCP